MPALAGPVRAALRRPENNQSRWAVLPWVKSWEVIAALLAVAAGLWSQVRSVISWITGLVVVTAHVDEETVRLVVGHLRAAGRRRTSGARHYSSTTMFVRPLGRKAWISWELPNAPGILWFGWRPLWITKVKDGVQSGWEWRFSHIRGTVDWEAILVAASHWTGQIWLGSARVRHHVMHHHGKTLGSEIAEQRDKSNDPKYREEWRDNNANRLIGWRPDEVGDPVGKSSKGLALAPELVSLVAEIKEWHQSEEWFATRGVPWRRGYLLHGPPGTGKTSLIRAESEDLDLPVHVFDLASMSNQDLRLAWSRMLEETPCVAVIEDIDAVFHGRSNVSTGGGMMSSGGLTFDALLNCVDGVQSTNGVLLFVTTNHLSSVDDALVRRPGRIDRVIEFRPLDLALRLQVARRILGDDGDAARVAEAVGDIPAAQFLELCCRRALEQRFAQAGPYR